MFYNVGEVSLGDFFKYTEQGLRDKFEVVGTSKDQICNDLLLFSPSDFFIHTNIILLAIAESISA